MHVLITGGCGFIGSNLAHYLYNKGIDDITCLDNLFLGKMENLNKYLSSRVINVDITNEREMQLLSRYGFDYIVHLAARSSAPMFQEDLHSAFKTNVIGTRNVFQLAKEIGSKIIYASTSSLYSGLNTKFLENEMLTPNSYYELTKYINENEAYLWFKENGLKSVGLRFFSIYGKNEIHKGIYANLVSQFLWDMEKGKSPTIYGDGTQSRDFTWVEDVCEVIYRLMNINFKCNILNVGTGISTNLNEMIEIINDVLNTEISPRYIKNPIPNYIFHTEANVEKLRQTVGYIPQIPLKTGVEKLVGSKTL